MIATTKRVEDLDNFGKPLIEFPKKARRQQGMIFLRELRSRYGTFGMVRLLAEVTAERRRIRQRYADEFRRYETEIGPGVVKETQLLVSMFNVIARREGRENAYPVIRDMMTDVGPHSMRAMYQVDELVECDGDVYENFKKFHMAMFDADLMQTVFRNTQTDSGDSFTFLRFFFVAFFVGASLWVFSEVAVSSPFSGIRFGFTKQATMAARAIAGR